jgi:hypothetical protein
MEHFQSDPKQELPLETRNKGAFHLRFAYGRALETQNTNDSGQDYLTFGMSEQEISFCICDGVSLSYYGNLSAQYLGDALLKHLQQTDYSASNQMEIQQSLQSFLQHSTTEASRLIQLHVIPSSIQGIFREVMEEKKLLGSETTFVCGKISLVNGKMQLVLAWLGDTRIKLWHHDQEMSHLLPGTFDTSQRWSTVKGIIGDVVHVFTGEISQSINRIQVYTDGLKELDHCKKVSNDSEIQQLIKNSYTQSTSDDIAFLDIMLESISLDSMSFTPKVSRRMKTKQQTFSLGHWLKSIFK